MGASGSKPNASAVAPRMNGMNRNVESGMGTLKNKNGAAAPRVNGMNRNVESGLNGRANTTSSDPGTPGSTNTRRNNRNRNRRNNVAINVNRLQEVVVEEPPQANAGEGLVGNNQAGGYKGRRKGSRKASRKAGRKSRRH